MDSRGIVAAVMKDDAGFYHLVRTAYPFAVLVRNQELFFVIERDKHIWSDTRLVRYQGSAYGSNVFVTNDTRLQALDYRVVTRNEYYIRLSKLTTRKLVYELYDKEREAQDAQWGGPTHDDEHGVEDWADFIDRQLGLLREALGNFSGPPDNTLELCKERFVKIGALATAAIESISRQG